MGALGQSLSLTADHYVPFANGTYATAQNVKAGDAVWVKGRVGEMIKTAVTKVGLLEGMMPETHIPAAYDAVFTPVHLLHRLFPGWLERFAENVAGVGSLDEKGVAGIAHAAMTTVLK